MRAVVFLLQVRKQPWSHSREAGELEVEPKSASCPSSSPHHYLSLCISVRVTSPSQQVCKSGPRRACREGSALGQGVREDTVENPSSPGDSAVPWEHQRAPEPGWLGRKRTTLPVWREKEATGPSLPLSPAPLCRARSQGHLTPTPLLWPLCSLSCVLQAPNS